MFGKGEEKATAATFEVELRDGAPSDVVHLLPMGLCVPNDGREPWVLEDIAHAEQVLEATRAYLGQRDLHLDYDHQAETAPPVGGTAIAAGWASASNLYADEQGIWARGVQWTRAAAAKLADREYRYISPRFGFTKKGRRITRILNAALTNNPALELTAVASQTHDGDHLEMKNIAQALGLTDDAGEDQILTSIATLKSSTASAAVALGLADSAGGEEIATAAGQAQAAVIALPTIATALGLDADADATAIATAAAEVKTKADAGPDPSKFVPIGELAAANAKLDSINTEKGEAEVDAAIAAGKLTPANRDWGLAAFRADPEGFATAMGNQVALELGDRGSAGAAKTGAAADLSDEERARCSSMGWDEETFAAQLKRDREAEEGAN